MRPDPDGAVRRRGERHRGQRDPLRGHVRRDLRARHRRRAVLRAQLRRAGRRRGRRRPRLRVHDRRHGSSCSAGSGATSRRACPAASPTCSTCRTAGSTRRWSTSTRSTTTTASSCATPSSATSPRPSRRWPKELLTEWDDAVDRFGKVMPKDYKRVLKAREAAEADGRDVERGDHGGRTWLTPRVPDHRPGAARRAGRSTCGCSDWREVYEDFPRPTLEKQAGRCMDCGIPFCHQGCPLGNLIPEWNDLVYRDDWREAIERLHATNNFPEFTGHALPRAVRGRVRAGINSDAVTIKQVEIEIIDRAWDEGWVAAAAAAEPAPARRWRWSAPARPGWRRRSSSPAPGTTSSCSSAPTASAGCCATASPSSRWRRPGSTGAWPRCAPRAPIFKAAVNVGTDVTAEQLPRRVRRGRARGRGHRVARPARARPRARRASTRRWSTCRGPTACSRATSTRPPITARASTS